MKTTSVRCSLHDWTIQVVPDLRSEDGATLFGETDAVTKVIRLRDGLDAKDQASTLLHEALHAAERSLGSYLGEEAVLKVEGMLILLMHQNQELFRELLKAFK